SSLISFRKTITNVTCTGNFLAEGVAGSETILVGPASAGISVGVTGGSMSEINEPRAPHLSMLARAEELQQQIQQISGRDLQLWSIGVLVIIVLTGGVLALLLPNVMWGQRVVRIDHSYVPQLFFGLTSLILLFIIYVLTQKLALNSTRRALIRELVLNERLENLSLV